jgi:hypothetical protein
MFLSKAEFTGHVILVAAHIGELACGEAIFRNEHGTALSAGGLVVGAEMVLSKAEFTGQVALYMPTSAAGWTASGPSSATSKVWRWACSVRR